MWLSETIVSVLLRKILRTNETFTVVKIIKDVSLMVCIHYAFAVASNKVVDIQAVTLRYHAFVIYCNFSQL